MENKLEVLREWVLSTAKLIVNNPDNLEVESKEDEQGLLFTIKADPQDRGLLIGRKGENANKFRALLSLLGLSNECRASLLIWSPDRPKTNPDGEPMERPENSY